MGDIFHQIHPRHLKLIRGKQQQHTCFYGFRSQHIGHISGFLDRVILSQFVFRNRLRILLITRLFHHIQHPPEFRYAGGVFCRCKNFNGFVIIRYYLHSVSQFCNAVTAANAAQSVCDVQRISSFKFMIGICDFCRILINIELSTFHPPEIVLSLFCRHLFQDIFQNLCTAFFCIDLLDLCRHFRHSSQRNTSFFT